MNRIRSRKCTRPPASSLLLHSLVPRPSRRRALVPPSALGLLPPYARSLLLRRPGSPGGVCSPRQPSRPRASPPRKIPTPLHAPPAVFPTLVSVSYIVREQKSGSHLCADGRDFFSRRLCEEGRHARRECSNPVNRHACCEEFLGALPTFHRVRDLRSPRALFTC